VPYVPLTGVVLDADGAFAAGARVFLKGGGARTFILAEPVVTDVSGRFTIAGLSGREYRLFAERIQSSDGKRRLENSEEVEITAQQGLPPARLRLKPAY
jgi:carboxypeptidase family protein